MSKTEFKIHNLFGYNDKIIQAIEDNLIKKIFPRCGDKLEHIVEGMIYFSCYNCGSVISHEDLGHIISNKDIDAEHQSACSDFLQTHGIFRCDGHKKELYKWTFQCLLLHEEDDRGLTVDYI